MRGGHTNPNDMFFYQIAAPNIGFPRDCWVFNPVFDWTYGKAVAGKPSTQLDKEKYFTGLDIEYYHNYQSGSNGPPVSSSTAKIANIFSKDNTTPRSSGGWYLYNPYS